MDSSRRQPARPWISMRLLRREEALAQIYGPLIGGERKAAVGARVSPISFRASPNMHIIVRCFAVLFVEDSENMKTWKTLCSDITSNWVASQYSLISYIRYCVLVYLVHDGNLKSLFEAVELIFDVVPYCTPFQGNTLSMSNF